MVLAGRDVQTGTAVSGAGHLAVLLWMILGGWISATEPLPPIGSTEVTLLSNAEFDALVNGTADAPQPSAATDVAAPAQPDVTTPEPPATPAARTGRSAATGNPAPTEHGAARA